MIPIAPLEWEKIHVPLEDGGEGGLLGQREVIVFSSPPLFCLPMKAAASADSEEWLRCPCGLLNEWRRLTGTLWLRTWSHSFLGWAHDLRMNSDVAWWEIKRPSLTEPNTRRHQPTPNVADMRLEVRGGRKRQSPPSS